MSLAQGNNTPTRPRIEPGSPDTESDALTTSPVCPPPLKDLCSRHSNDPKFSDKLVRANSADPDHFLEEQSDQGLHCLLVHLHLFDEKPYGLASLFELRVDYSKVFWRPKI